ncbi:MAG: cytochrome P450 [Halioglobus sp.]|nr:cytochrome P450 [Halioglobus sp.]
MTHLVSPKPPIVHEELAHIGAGLQMVDDPTGYLTRLREQYGDTFLVDVFGYQLFCTFSGKGLESLYKLEEDSASFGFATFDLLGFKTPTEIFLDTSLSIFYEMLGIRKLPYYIDVIHAVLDLELARLGDGGEVDVFDMIRTLEQRVGFGLWIGLDAAQDGTWQRLKAQFDVLSQEFAFVSPKDTLDTIVSGKARERAALQSLYDILGDIYAARDGKSGHEKDSLTFLYEKFSEHDEVTRQRKVAHNVINANQGFLSNLYAAIAWVVVRLLQREDVLEKVRGEIDRTEAEFGPGFLYDMAALNSMQYLEQVLMESVRMAQRSITLRKVLKPLEFDDGSEVYTVQPGAYITTLLSVTNMQTEELKRFDPDHYRGNRLRDELAQSGKETVSTFGHGIHACPAQKLSHAMCKILVARLLRAFELEQRFSDPRPATSQLGGVARPASPTRIRLQRRRV